MFKFIVSAKVCAKVLKFDLVQKEMKNSFQVVKNWQKIF